MAVFDDFNFGGTPRTGSVNVTINRPRPRSFGERFWGTSRPLGTSSGSSMGNASISRGTYQPSEPISGAGTTMMGGTPENFRGFISRPNNDSGLRVDETPFIPASAPSVGGFAATRNPIGRAASNMQTGQTNKSGFVSRYGLTEYDDESISDAGKRKLKINPERNISGLGSVLF